MTRTANKGAIRAAASARRNRHAQRTPLPGDTSQPVKGNPTAEALAEHVAEEKARKPRRKRAAAPEPSAEPVREQHDSRAFGAATDDLAQRAAEMIQQGMKQREVAAALGLADGKTGTAQVRRLLKVANGGTRPPRQRKAPTSKPLPTEEGYGGVPMQVVVPSWNLSAKDKRRGVGARRMSPVNCGPIGEAQVRSLKAKLEADGYTVETVGV